MIYRVLAVFFILLATPSWGVTPDSIVRDGDIIFQTSLSSQSVAIQRATLSPYSHMGLIFLRDGKPYVFEAVSTVRYTPLRKWIARGSGGHFVIRRLKNAEGTLDKKSVDKLRVQIRRFQGKPYDPTFEWSDDRIYCSELVWKIYDRALGIKLGDLQRLKEFNLTDPIVSSKLRERYGLNVPMEELVISPEEVFRSPQLLTVLEK